MWAPVCTAADLSSLLFNEKLFTTKSLLRYSINSSRFLIEGLTFIATLQYCLLIFRLPSAAIAAEAIRAQEQNM